LSFSISPALQSTRLNVNLRSSNGYLVAFYIFSFSKIEEENSIYTSDLGSDKTMKSLKVTYPSLIYSKKKPEREAD